MTIADMIAMVQFDDEESTDDEDRVWDRSKTKKKRKQKFRRCR